MIHSSVTYAISNWEKVQPYLRSSKIGKAYLYREKDEKIFNFILFCFGYFSLIGAYSKEDNDIEYLMDQLPIELFFHWMKKSEKENCKVTLEFIEKLANDLLNDVKNNSNEEAEYYSFLESVKYSAEKSIDDFKRVMFDENEGPPPQMKISESRKISAIRKIRKIVNGKKTIFPVFFNEYFKFLDENVFNKTRKTFFSKLKNLFGS